MRNSNYSLYLIATYFFFSILFISCAAPIKPVEIDNPTDKEITVLLDGEEEIVVPAVKSLIVEMKFGKRKISVDGVNLGVINLESENEYFLNPTRAKYYKYNHYFFDTQAGRREMAHIIEAKHKIDGQTLIGDITELPQEILIQKSWRLGISESLPMHVGVKSKKSYASVSQIYRKEHMFIFSEEMMDAIEQ